MTASEITAGQKLRVRFGTYTVRVASSPRRGRDRWGREMVKFEAEILDGPDRIGDVGEMTFGPLAFVEALS